MRDGVGSDRDIDSGVQFADEARQRAIAAALQCRLSSASALRDGSVTAA
jgi:hypothetical protein